MFCFWKKDKKKIDKISLQESFDLTGLLIVTFKQNNNKYNFILDTGATNTCINKDTLETLEFCNISDINDGTVFGADGNIIKTDFIGVELSYKDMIFKDIVQVMDLTQAIKNIKEAWGVTVHGFLGSSFMKRYGYVIDFQEMVAYSTKNFESTYSKNIESTYSKK